MISLKMNSGLINKIMTPKIKFNLAVIYFLVLFILCIILFNRDYFEQLLIGDFLIPIKDGLKYSNFFYFSNLNLIIL